MQHQNSQSTPQNNPSSNTNASFLPKTLLNLAASSNNNNIFNLAAVSNHNSGQTPSMPFRSASNRLGSFLQMHDGPVSGSTQGGGPPLPRFSFNEMPFGSNAGEALLNSAVPKTSGLGPGISELLQNQMPSHKMSIDFTNSRQSDPK